MLLNIVKYLKSISLISTEWYLAMVLIFSWIPLSLSLFSYVDHWPFDLLLKTKCLLFYWIIKFLMKNFMHEMQSLCSLIHFSNVYTLIIHTTINVENIEKVFVFFLSWSPISAVTTDLTSVIINFTYLGLSNKWNHHMVCTFLCLAFSTQQNVLEIH